MFNRSSKLQMVTRTNHSKRPDHFHFSVFFQRGANLLDLLLGSAAALIGLQRQPPVQDLPAPRGIRSICLLGKAGAAPASFQAQLKVF